MNDDLIRDLEMASRPGPGEMCEGRTPEEIAAARMGLADPNILPSAFDNSFDAWLFRIGQWGKIIITHIDGDTRRKRKVSQREMVRIVTDPGMYRVFGSWDSERLDINKMEMTRKYTGLDGRTKTERFIIEVKLSPKYKAMLRGR